MNLTLLSSSTRQFKKSSWFSELFDDKRQDTSLRIADQMFKKVFNSVRSFVTGRNRIGERDAVMAHVDGNDGGERTALRKNCYSRRVAYAPAAESQQT